MKAHLYVAGHSALVAIALLTGCGAASRGDTGVSRRGERLYERALERARASEEPIKLAEIPEIRARQEAVAARQRLPWGTDVVPVDAGGARAEWISLPGASADRVVIYLHGGGYAFGSVASHRRIMALVGEAARARVLGVDYRLAPEYPFPAALEDILAAYTWLLKGGFQADRIAFVGDSAGGGLALSAMVKLKERSEPLPAAAVLVSPWVDLTGSSPSVTKNAEIDPILRWDGGLEVLARAYIGDDSAQNPLISPLYANLEGLPPVLVLAGEQEILLDDAKKVAQRLHGFGVDTRLRIFPGMWHGWQFHTPRLPEAVEAVEGIGAFLKRAFEGT